MSEDNKFTVAKSEDGKSFILIHLNTQKQWVLSLEEFKWLYAACKEWAEVLQ